MGGAEHEGLSQRGEGGALAVGDFDEAVEGGDAGDEVGDEGVLFFEGGQWDGEALERVHADGADGGAAGDGFEFGAHGIDGIEQPLGAEHGAGDPGDEVLADGHGAGEHGGEADAGVAGADDGSGGHDLGR